MFSRKLSRAAGNGRVGVKALQTLQKASNPRGGRWMSLKTMDPTGSRDDAAHHHNGGGGEKSQFMPKSKLSRPRKKGVAPQAQTRFKRPKRKEFERKGPTSSTIQGTATTNDINDNDNDHHANNSERLRHGNLFPFSSSSLIQPSPYLWHLLYYPAQQSASASSSSSTRTTTTTPPTPVAAPLQVLYSLDASAFLDQARFCKLSARASKSHRQTSSRTISGTAAATRLLRGKKRVTDEVKNWLYPPHHSPSHDDDEEDDLLSNQQNQQPVMPSCSSNRRRRRRRYPAATRQYLALEGHGVPPSLLQHCVDMGDALLQHYGAVESCSFHNFYNVDERRTKKRRNENSNNNNNNNLGEDVPIDVDTILYERLIPPWVVKRRQEGGVSCVKPPASMPFAESGDWNHHLSLYLTVMERLARNLGYLMDLGRARYIRQAKSTSSSSSSLSSSSSSLSSSSSSSSFPENSNHIATARDKRKDEHATPPPIQDYFFDNDEEDPTSSVHLFPESNPWNRPRWNVDIMNRRHLGLQPLQSNNGNFESDTVGHNAEVDAISPFPIVELVPPADQSQASGRVLIRLQGCARPNDCFPDVNDIGSFDRRSSSRHVTLVFDASLSTSTPPKPGSLLEE